MFAEEFQAKKSGEALYISIMKYRDISRISQQSLDSAYPVNTVCILSLNTGVSFMKPGVSITVDI